MRFSVPEDKGRITAFVRSNSWVCREAVARDGGAVKNLLPQSRKDRIGCDQKPISRGVLPGRRGPIQPGRRTAEGGCPRMRWIRAEPFVPNERKSPC